VERLIVSRCDGLRRRALALTFDDGPSQWTPAMLDVLGEHEARATFFVVGRYVEERPELVARMAREGHEIGNHTFDHVHAADEEGLSLTVLWSTDGPDWEEPPPERIAAEVLRGVEPGAIVHDGVPPGERRGCAGTVAALARILPARRGNGYELVTVSELLAVR
jgi:peptidoglycan/xylan/chitin deacetylase (PgdA/CDA1 family)